MSMLRDIQNDVLDEGKSLSAVLRRCKVLAHRIKYEPLNQWVELELGGYLGIESLPEYRKTGVALKASGANSAWIMTGQNIPVHVLPGHLQEMASTGYFLHGVGALEANQDKEGLHFDAPAPVRQWIETDGAGNLTITSLYQEIPPGAIKSVLSDIRNRVLAFTLRIEDEFPDLVDSQLSSDELVKAAVANAFQVTITGGSPVINIGSSVAIHHDNRQIIVNDLPSLHKYLESEGFDPADFDELDASVVDAVAVREVKHGRGRIVEWAGEAAKKVTSKTGTVMYKVATEVAVKAAMTYLGLD